MKLLFVVKALTGHVGGAEKVLTTISGALADRGHEVAIATFDPEGSTPFYKLDPRVTFLPLAVGDAQRQSGVGEVLARVRRLRAACREIRPDVAVGFLHSSFVPLALALVGTGIPVVASEHTVFDHYADKPVERTLIHLVRPMVAAFTGLSERARDSYPPSVRAKMRVLPNPVDKPGKLADVVGGADKTLLSVGRLSPEKDHATLIAAFRLLADRFREWTLRIVGDGERRLMLEQQVADLGLEGRVVLPGAVSEIGQEYSAAQLFAIPSRYEGFGLVTIEAMAHGLPVIGFADCPGTNEIIADGVNGILASGPDRAKAMAQSIEELLRSPRKRERFGKAAELAAHGTDAAVIASQWEALFYTLAH